MMESMFRITDIICSAFRHIDPRFNNHGERVAYILMQMFQDKSEISPKEKQNIFMLGLLHDIGAYKEEEFDSMLSFDQNDSMEHAVYGYLLFRTFSPLKEDANVILYHHQCNAQYYSVPISDYHRRLARILYLADRIDIFCQFNDTVHLLPFLEGYQESVFTPEDIQWFLEADRKYHILEALHTGSYQTGLKEYMSDLTFTEEQIRDYLTLLIFAIDFRSEYSVLHTSYAFHLSRNLARMMNLSETALHAAGLSALFHNIGKISLPPLIQNKEDYASYLHDVHSHSIQEITKKILKGNVNDAILQTIEESFHILNCWAESRPMDTPPEPVSELVALSCILSNELTLEPDAALSSHAQLLSFLRSRYRTCSMDDSILSSLEQQYDRIIQETQASCSSIWDAYKKIREEYHSLTMILQHYNQKYH